MILLAIALLAAAPPAHAAHATKDEAARATRDVDRAADEVLVLDTADQLLGRLTGKDPARMEALTLKEGGATAIVDGAGGKAVLRHFTWPDFFSHLPKTGPVIEEHMRNPLVRVDGDVAMVWGAYVVTVDGKFLHCGTDHFDLVRVDGRWRILNVTWNQRKEGCRR